MTWDCPCPFCGGPVETGPGSDGPDTPEEQPAPSFYPANGSGPNDERTFANLSVYCVGLNPHTQAPFFAGPGTVETYEINHGTGAGFPRRPITASRRGSRRRQLERPTITGPVLQIPSDVSRHLNNPLAGERGVPRHPNHPARGEEDADWSLVCYGFENAWDPKEKSSPKVIPVIPFHGECCGIFGLVLRGAGALDLIQPPTPGNVEVRGTGADVELIPRFPHWDEIDLGILWRTLAGPNPAGKRPYPYRNSETKVLSPIEGLPSLALIDAPAADFIQSHARSAVFAPSPSVNSIAHDGKSRSQDIFHKLPYDVVYMIAGLLPLQSVVSLVRASRAVNIALPCDSPFWRRTLALTLPWIWELQPLLTQDAEFLEKINAKKFAIWLDHATSTTTKGTAHPSLYVVANRRRAWNICERVAEEWMDKHDGLRKRPCYQQERIIAHAAEAPLVTVADGTETSDTSDAKKCFWLHTWDDINSFGDVKLETFWSHGTLAGISLLFQGKRRGLLASRDVYQVYQRWSDLHILKDVVTEKAQISARDWVAGFVFSIPSREGSGLNYGYRCVGVTIVTTSGVEINHGDCASTHLKHAMLARGDSYVAGVYSTQFQREEKVLSNFDLNNGEHLFQPIEKLGLLVANRPPGGVYPIDDSKPCPPTMPRQHEAGILDPQELVWRGKATFSGLPIWRHSKLKIVAPLTTPLKPCPVPHEALVWGQDENDLTNMSRITAYVTTRTMHMSMDEQTEILGLCVEFTADSGISPRIIGLAMDPRTGKAWPKQFSRSLDIDCPGGERITEIWWSKYPVYWHMKMQTNRGRELSWCRSPANTQWETLQAHDGSPLVGLVTEFEVQSALFPRQRGRPTPLLLSGIAALALPRLEPTKDTFTPVEADIPIEPEIRAILLQRRSRALGGLDGHGAADSSPENSLSIADEGEAF